MATNVIVTGGEFEHDDEVAQSFIKGYQSNGARYTGNLLVQNFGQFNTQSALDYALNSNYSFVIQSTVGAYSNNSLSISYYPDVLLFMPAGSNSFEQVYSISTSANQYPIVITSAMTGNNQQNVTGFNTEFLDIDPLYGAKISSYANGYIAGKIAYIRDYLNCSLYEARMIARLTASYTDNFSDVNGYGRINIYNAINNYVSIPDDPFAELSEIGALQATRNENNINISFDLVTNANGYKVYRNYEMIYNGTNTNIIDTISPMGRLEYKYKAYNRKTETSYSQTENISFDKYQSIFYIK